MSRSKQSLLFAGISLAILLTVSTRQAYAMAVPNFGSCLNPQVAASQVNTGANHGVAGQSSAYSGTDTIYSLQDGNVLQCLCPVEGSGIETEWMKISGISQEELNSFQSQGWIYIPTGAAWGLEDVPYLAKNSDYSCKGSNQSTSSNSNSGNNGQSTATVVSASTQQGVLGLASTGTALPIYALIFAGFVSLFLGVFLSRSNRK